MFNDEGGRKTPHSTRFTRRALVVLLTISFDSILENRQFGAWSCDKNRKSRDALVILNDKLALQGKPWRGNLRHCISTATTTKEWLKALFEKCATPWPGGPLDVTMAIDTPLGFSEKFMALVTRGKWCEPNDDERMNCYLFRHTERHLCS